MEKFNLENMNAENKYIKKYQAKAKAMLVTQMWKMEMK